MDIVSLSWMKSSVPNSAQFLPPAADAGNFEVSTLVPPDEFVA
ncbi:MAG: hypothetical protein WA421_05805 [Nitrososphaeraceae archaeon]